jgi:hypothetical protein
MVDQAERVDQRIEGSAKSIPYAFHVPPGRSEMQSWLRRKIFMAQPET